MLLKLLAARSSAVTKFKWVHQIYAAQLHSVCRNQLPIYRTVESHFRVIMSLNDRYRYIVGFYGR